MEDNFFLKYTSKGEGKPLLLVHGFGEDRNMWEAQIEYFSKKYWVIAPDLGGFGESANLLPSEVSVETLSEQIYALLYHLKVEKFVYVGHSLGSYIGLALAEVHPEIFQGLCLFNSTALADSEERKKVRKHTIDFIEKNGLEKYADSFVHTLFHKPERAFLKESIEKTKNTLKNTPQKTIIEVIKAMHDRINRTHILVKADYPILYIIGREDITVSMKDYAQQILIPKEVNVQVLPEIGHMAMFEAPQKTLAILEAFMTQVWID